MKLENKYVAIWLLDEAARLFLGLSQPTKGAAVPEEGPTRWEVLGKVQSDGESGVGVWLEIDVLKERHGPKAQSVAVSYQVGLHHFHSGSWRGDQGESALRLSTNVITTAPSLKAVPPLSSSKVDKLQKGATNEAQPGRDNARLHRYLLVPLVPTSEFNLRRWLR
jgi:hypothetical protein